jgi:NodT family efflux transporter outer membrane factor (OMF) lipoprotein
MIAFHNASAVAARDAALPSTPIDTWWTGFNDPMLVTIVKRSLDQNLDLAASLARVQQARAGADAAGAQLLPTVDLNIQGSAERQSLNGPIGEIGKHLPGYNRNQRLYDVGAAASWEIDLFGGLHREAAASTDEFEAAEAEHAGIRISVAADAADAYMQVRGYQARLTVALDQIRVNTDLLNVIRLRHGSGVSTDRELAQAEGLLKQAQATVPLLRISLEAQLNRLDVLMGAQPGTYAQELEAPGEVPLVPAIGKNDEPLDVLRRRPDIIAAERRLAASNERIGAAIADYYPKISLSGALGFESLSLNHLVTPASFQPIGTGAIRWRLFDFGKVDAEVAQAHGSNEEALALYKQAALKAAEDVENAFMALTQTEVRTQELQDEVASLTRARDLSQQSYQAGVIPLTDVLDADRQLLAARDDLASNRADAARAAVRSFRALGGGWKI